MDFNPFQPALPPNLIPNPPGEIPQAQSAGDAVAITKSPFTEAQDINQIIAQLSLDRPLKLYIPNRHHYPQHEFRIINSIPQEIADAHNKGWNEVTDPELAGMFTDLVAGTDKTGKAYRPILCARPKQVGDHVRNQNRLQLRSLYAGMDPKNKDMGGRYTDNVDTRGGTFLQREGAPWNIRLKP